MKLLPYILLLLSVFIFVPFSASAIPITSSKGKTVDFAGVKSASPAGLEVQVKKDGPIVTLSWSRLDLRKLETENPKIHEARKKTLRGEKVELNLGSIVAKKTVEAKPTGLRAKREAQGVYQTTIKGKAGDNFNTLRVAVKLPEGKVKGVFVYLSGEAMASPDGGKHFVAGLIDTTSTPIATRGPWFEFAAQHGLAILGVSIDETKGAKKGSPPYYEVSKGTGEALYRAIDMIAVSAKKEELKTVPLVLYGRDVGGGALVYNFVLWKPERIAAAVVSKGAFYNAEPIETSAKIPMMFIEGEYDNDWELYGGKNLASEVFGKHVELDPNWVYALEPQGTSGDSLAAFTLAKDFLSVVTPLRIGNEGLKEIDRSSSWVGDIEAKKIFKAGAGAKGAAGRCWLPDARFAKTWLSFVSGTL